MRFFAFARVCGGVFRLGSGGKEISVANKPGNKNRQTNDVVCILLRSFTLRQRTEGLKEDSGLWGAGGQ